MRTKLQVSAVALLGVGMFLLNVIPTSAQGVVLSENEVTAAVMTWVRDVTADRRPDAAVASVEAYGSAGETEAYIVHLVGGGYCLCACDPLLLPVYLYNPSGEYDPEDGVARCILDGIVERTRRFRQAVEQGDPRVARSTIESRREYWRTLLAGQIPASLAGNRFRPEVPDSVVLNLTSEWRQSSPFNDLCPEVTPGIDEHAVVGCGGTAIAQLMYYWKWPDSGTGFREKDTPRRSTQYWIHEPCPTDPGTIPDRFEGRLAWTSVSGGLLRANGYWDVSVLDAARGISSNADFQEALDELWDRLTPDPVHYEVDFLGATYDWDIMTDVCTEPPGSGELEVAKLSYHAAVAVNSRFGVWATAHNIDRFPEAFVDNFRYDPAQSTTANIDPSVPISEVDWMRPIGVAGCGHTWVIDGYKISTSQFHMNYGWGTGSHDVWHTLDGAGAWCSDVTRFGILIAPESVVRFVGGGVGGDGSPTQPYADIDQAVGMAPDGATLIFHAHQDHRFASSAATITREVMLKGYNATIGTSADDRLHICSDVGVVQIHGGGAIRLE